jgi:glycosyltransferase involved in cell wall biosynthesis
MSQAIADQLTPAPTTVVYENAPAEFRPDRAGRVRASLGIPDTAPLVGAAGRIDTWKGFDVLLDAFEHAQASSAEELHLVVAGGPVPGKESLFGQLAARAAQTTGAHWLGPRTDLPDVLADLDVFVLPTTEPEPYGLVVVEALASGVPVVVTDAGGPREIAAQAGAASAILVPPADAAALAGGVAAALARAGRSSAESRRTRVPLRDAPPERFAEIFRALVRRR